MVTSAADVGGTHLEDWRVRDGERFAGTHVPGDVGLVTEHYAGTEPATDEARIRSAMNGHLCRYGTYPRVLKGFQLASKGMS
jgi:aerobic-type carbon monoxide dehydrogenase small subunit (CoxS/CutS family)